MADAPLPDHHRISDLLDAYAEETRCVQYNGWHRYRSPDDIRKDLDREIESLLASQAAPPSPPVAAPSGEVQVCPECDIAGCRHLRAPQPPRPSTAPLSDEQIEKLRQETFSTNNPFCPCDSKTMRKAVRAAERAHGITED